MDDIQHSAAAISTNDIPGKLPILPIVDTNLFPKMVLPLVLIQKEAIDLIDEAMAGSRMLGLILSRKPEPGSKHRAQDLYRIGTVAMILKMSKMEDEKAQLLIQGLNRFKTVRFLQGKPYLQAEIEVLTCKNTDRTVENRALMANIAEQYEKIVTLSPGLPAEMAHMIKSLQEPNVLADMVASSINAPVEEKQKVLEMLNVNQRLKKVTRLVNDQLEILEMGSRIQNQVKEDMDRQQREYYLRRQLKAIREELGETDSDSVEIREYRALIQESRLPEEAEKEAQRELQRLSRMHPSSSEYVVASTYLDWLTSLPWHEASRDVLDIRSARRILNQDHYGLDKPKKRILEFLAVRKLKKNSKGPILCFTGPPGTGKTSLGRSIAKALGREFVRISLGGVRDEAEIRGHRRTYVGALPGRIIQNIRKAGKKNPVFMLDEIDKLDSSYRGDPSSALLEVLDPEQNNTFTDHYLDVAFDLSDVMFLATANVMHTIPPPLRDRMEVLELNGYTEDEKHKIATRYLIPRQRDAHGLTAGQIRFTPGAVRKIISGYTRESGLRNLERQIGTICRGVATKIAEAQALNLVIRQDDLHEYLGPVQHIPDLAQRIHAPGVVVGLAWTPVGGEILFVEAVAMKGGRELTLTGQLGEVMKESAATALSFIRSHAEKLKVDDTFFDTHDIHVHVPAGSIPKDGPSAGVTMLVALVSLISNRKVRPRLAMTGEITLRGEVLPVGGIKEKIIAAHRAGVKSVILPLQNQKDMEDVPRHIQDQMSIVFTDNMEDIILHALDP
jgi:ATP-dependent Lon protease